MSKKESNTVTRSVIFSRDLIEILEFFQKREKPPISFAHVIRKSIYESVDIWKSRMSEQERKDFESFLKEKDINL